MLIENEAMEKFIGAVIIFEALAAIVWKNNNKKLYAQLARVTRIVCGIVLLHKKRS